MISDFEETIKESTRHIQLSEEEKGHIRMRLVSFMRMKPVRTSLPVRLTERSSSHIISAFLFKYMPIIIGLVLFISGGMSFAAENSLPGDVLYPLKVHVNERILGNIAFSQKAKAEWESARAERRLQEVERLAVENRLSAETQAQLTARISASASEAGKHITELQSRGDLGTAAVISADLESSLDSHQKILSILAKNKKEIRTQLQAIAVHVREESERMGQVRVNIEVLAAKDEHARAAVEGKIKAAEHKLNEVLIFIQKTDSFSAEVLAQINAQAEAAQSVIVEAKAKIETGAYEESFRLLQKAMQIAQDTKQFAHTHVRLNLSLDAGILGIHLKNESRADSNAEIENKNDKEEDNDDKEETKKSEKENRSDLKDLIKSRIETETRIRVNSPITF